MEYKKYTRILQIVSTILCLAILFVLFKVVPDIGLEIIGDDKEFYYAFYPWLIIICLEGLPIVLCGLICIRIYENIGNNRIFVRENIKAIKLIDKILLVLMVFIVIANIFALILLEHHPGLLLIHLIYLIVLFLIHICIKLLLKIYTNAVELKEDQDLTV
ncbi:MAG: DUF2975 domain-containing protein [Miniphocaeibacter sp.]|uniref:DUF2975 domain-containing protein n=1 Tax=Miniphocaeibacter sp. TaxID=3100973 RepID=UPI00185E89E1|nr:DUF2975 domain-containing protein [Gallicola sp.]